ncbi:uncharacterized protein LOC110811871 [Carica papaya]|uniref:uncharacterized protein LOC110811871 n=1 Tax=Carica papaya TaxID=3649 RepID=UPI000B8C9AE8|nr:uncharacterized protein LOC110811871 [Carica papaya]
MLPLHFLCLKNTPPFSIAEPLYFQKNPKIVFSRHPVLTGGDEDGIKRRRGRTTVHAVEKDSQQFEVDPDKAKQALKQLDLQLESLSKKQVSTPKIKASDVKLTRNSITEEQLPELSGSFLAYSAFALLAFTIFYNVLFYSVIKPSIDGPVAVLASTEETVSSASFLQLLQPILELFSVQR